MLTRITLNGSQIAHGSNLTEALEMLADDGYKIDSSTVELMFSDDDSAILDGYGFWQVETEPVFDGQMVRAACESGDSFIAVQMDMEGRLSNLA